MYLELNSQVELVCLPFETVEVGRMTKKIDKVIIVCADF